MKLTIDQATVLLDMSKESKPAIRRMCVINSLRKLGLVENGHPTVSGKEYADIVLAIEIIPQTTIKTREEIFKRRNSQGYGEYRRALSWVLSEEEEPYNLDTSIDIRSP